MPSILDTLSALITPEMVSGLGKQVGLSDEPTRRGIVIANAVLTGGMARASSTPAGAAMIAQMIDKADSSVLSNLIGVAASATAGPNDAASQIFGRNLPLIMGGVKKATGIDITPFLAVSTPVVLGVIKNLARQQKLDPDGLGKLLRTEMKGLSRRDPATAQVLKEVFKPLEGQDKLRAAFSAEEWARLRQAPLNAAVLIKLADRSGGGGRSKEIAALCTAIAEAATNAGPAELIGLLFYDNVSPADVEALVKAHRKTDEQELRSALLTPITEAVAIAKAKAPSGDAIAYQGLLIDVAQKVASAANEGGFLGMGSTLISIQEKIAIDELAAAVAAG
jgi:hypothetical protein